MGKDEWWEDLNNTAVRIILDAIAETNKLEEFKEEAYLGLDQFTSDEKLMIKREAILAYCRVKSYMN
ncbi:hypothetical protein EZV73_05980 [Acidaminobacter sp. JC074]|uniref:hypothetical protein n=1 Tax=Acidaminobacter sp. JC074 TaxID=2530199 RepID=UPI001F0EC51E|nr:hypothetical protein [Acidaminobacter sp. JC074]MCH4887108.1 hypothetical protein [Acidaminobacter sp. JC074]